MRDPLPGNDPTTDSQGIAVNGDHSDHRGSIPIRSDGDSTTHRNGYRPSVLGRTCLLLIGCCLVTGSVGCMRLPIRHGMIFKGDWSFEMNRIPWMKGRGDVYQEPSECEVVQTVCATEIDSPFASGRPGLAARAHCREPGCGLAAHGPPDSGPTAGYHNHARFHPVPTRSVFSPQAGMVPERVEQTRPPALPPVRSVPKSLDPPTPSKSEDIPTPAPMPAPLPTESPNGQATAHSHGGSRQVSWIFSPSSDAGNSGMDDAGRHVARGADRALR